MVLDVAKEYVYVGRIFPAPFGRVPNRAICAAQILERIQLVDITTVWIEKHQIQRKFPLQGESAGELVSRDTMFPGVVDKDPGRNKCLIDAFNDQWF